MSSKLFITTGVIIGSMIGSYVPLLWGDSSSLSVSSLFFSMVGGLAGIWAGYKISKSI